MIDAMEFNFPLNWDDVKIFSDDPYKITQNLRSAESEKKYKEETRNNDTFLSSLKVSLDANTHVFMDCKYPYDVKAPILHRIMWLKNMSTSNEWVNPYDITKITELIEEDMKKLGFTKYLMYQNPPRYRSVLLHPHYHVFYC